MLEHVLCHSAALPIQTKEHKPFHALRARLAREFALNARASRLCRDLAFLKFTRIRVESRVDRVTTRARGA